MGGEAGDRGGGAVEAAGTRGNRQQDGCERNKRSFLCNGKWWRPAFFIVLSLSLHPHHSIHILCTHLHHWWKLL